MEREPWKLTMLRLFQAVDEPIFSSTYAKMCQSLLSKDDKVPSATEAQALAFRKLLLGTCQKEFEKDKASLQDVESKRRLVEEAESEEKKKELADELEELINKNRRRSLGNIR